MTPLEAIELERAKYGERLSPAEAIALLNAVAVRFPGYGLLQKKSGNRFDDKAMDIIFDRNTATHYDALIDAPDTFVPYEQAKDEQKPFYRDGVYWGTCRPTWEDKGHIDISRWVAPVGTPPADPVPDPPSDDRLEAAIEQIGALTGLVTDLFKRLDDVDKKFTAAGTKMSHDLAALQARTDSLVTRFNDLEGRLREPVSTSRWFGHSHKLEILK